MSTSEQSQAATRMFARVMGPFIVVLDGGAAVRAPELWQHLSQFSAEPLRTWTAGAFALLIGLVVIGLHPYWRGALAIIISVVGWLVAVKGFFLIMFPDTLMSIPDNTAGAITWWRVLYVGIALLGLYLSYVGWNPAARRSAPQEAKTLAGTPGV
ncbi:hypothetical protein K3U94_03550 [Mycolicibacter heraklionensis]|uniref:Uncharacterized protein n=1 Tax=Mycolicibacter heraklionensis TaxID=512402 RepID=A0A9X7ZFU3_9MYCO|nr:hypothetical protein [Mycolicibacter heraklionensis]QZA08404.1 hypothetical protein K3U94_03550 [Mycolicibacter heraklionensis]